MEKQRRKVAKYLSILKDLRFCNLKKITDISVCPCDYKVGHTPPPLSNFVPFGEGELWGDGWDSHAWFHFSFEVPEHMRQKPVQLLIDTNVHGWYAESPQFIVYVNGELRQAIDLHHHHIMLGEETAYDVYAYAYMGSVRPNASLSVSIRNLNVDVEQLWYDIRVPFEAAGAMRHDTGEYAQIMMHLDKAVTMLDLFELGSEDFFASVKDAKKYMDEEFYGKYCTEQPMTTICIGHTHIDCAWKWTLKQTREKVQRSFANVLELMKRYPEYKFMSSQALLYQNLKEEAPQLYEQVKERIREGRWECEGAMWVEADCNLSSGESLVRQVMYGKQFFKDEFGVENHILWLPDVFGYSAALPQILRKSGVDWFVTSKISWNDTNMMPYDTFLWQGIDGTKINTYFLTAQDKTQEDAVNYTTYVGDTNAKMILGTWHRYQQKYLNDEVIDTFGYGDGGGGPTAEMLEMARRSAKGIPGIPNAKIDFAGNFLNRLEKKIENNPLLPEWHGELYLEFHRGTYTTVSKNKRNNRQCEFLCLDAELMASIAKALFSTPFPKKELHNVWESLLTNQFHDIIPGSSIKEVYDQSDIDYAEIRRVAGSIVDATKQRIAESLDAKNGYVVFNPHSFVGNGMVEIDGKSALVSGIAPKGYSCVSSVQDTNGVKIDGRTVQTNCFTVTFDDAWQITSIYDKVNDREVLKNGAVGNELRIYADHPDQYDAWEWQNYSRDSYKVITAVESAETVEDGCRKGLRLVRPYHKSKITQTVWFYDDIAKIDFDTVADWHEQHVMLKAAFPVDINTDKATYEIQFGNIERPTHFNTTWDNAKFEVCAQKYADLSENGYGVSLINDCKYGHDVHDGVMQLSLLRSAIFTNANCRRTPTTPIEDIITDQGENCFTYSLCPHAGTLAESKTVEYAYYLNYPMTALKACGKENKLPTNFSAVKVNRDNVICETVKEAESGGEEILRLYECKNMRTKTEVAVSDKYQKAYLCDLLENAKEELPIKDGKITLTLSGFEIVTLKLEA